jgi:hypothetical protein
VRSCDRLKKCNVHLCQKVSYRPRLFQASAAPRPKNSDSDEKDALFVLDTQYILLFDKFYCFLWFCFCPTGAFFSNALETTKDNVKVSTNFIQLILYETVKQKQKMLTILLLKCH